MSDLNEEVLVALRRIMRAVDLHSRQLVQEHGITGPQALVLRRLSAQGPIPVGGLARAVNLSQGTVTGILDRLERRGLASRVRSETDRRQVLAMATDSGQRVVSQALPLLQESFTIRFSQLPDWEQMQMVACLKHLAALMDAEKLDAAPVLAIDPLSSAPLSSDDADPARETG